MQRQDFYLIAVSQYQSFDEPYLTSRPGSTTVAKFGMNLLYQDNNPGRERSWCVSFGTGV